MRSGSTTDVRRLALTWAAAVLAAGCTVGPDYSRPPIESPAAWRIDYAAAVNVTNTKWWDEFGDPVLNALIDEALRANRNLFIAAARVDQFVGQLALVRSQFYPQIGYSLDASRNRASRVARPPLAPGADPYYTLYQSALSAQWQIDLFGGVRRQSQAAQAEVYASEQGRRGVVLTLVTSVATTYIALRALDRQLEIAQATAKNYAATAHIFDLRFKGGVVSELELSQVQSQYQQALAAIPALEQQIAATENLLSVLLGHNPGPIPRGRTIDELATPGIPANLPSSLLERRPDILQAEQILVAADADIGAVKALYFPTLSLTGLLGTVSTAFSDFLTGPASAWTLAAGLTGPIFTFGLIEGQLQSAEAFQREALATYQQVILNAFQETNDALVGTVKKRQEAEAQAKRVAALREYARFSRLRFDNGYASYLEVLYAENELFSAELAAVRAQAERYTQLVNVYKAMGGGWVDEADRVAPQPHAARDGQSAVPGGKKE
jgi:multidrug efflux system outer membrane protein